MPSIQKNDLLYILGFVLTGLPAYCNKNNMGKNLIMCCLFVIAFASCSKTGGTMQLNNPSFSATVNGNRVNFNSPVTARSLMNSNGVYELEITGENRITTDSSVLISFVIPDFTRHSIPSATHALNLTSKGNYIEKKTAGSSIYGKLHYFQNGQLTVSYTSNQYLKGSFSFTCFLNDTWGNKTGEISVTEGNFADVIVER